MVKTICPSLKCQWYLADIGRSIAELSRTFLLHCLNPVCSTTPSIRAKVVIGILSTTDILRRQAVYRPILGDLVEYFLQIRLESGLNLEWSIFDPYIIDTLKMEGDMPISNPLVHAVARQLHIQNGNFGERAIQDSLWSYLRTSLPRMDADLIKMLKRDIETLDKSSERDAFLDALSDFPAVSGSNRANGRLILAPHLWRQRLHDLIQEIVAPDSLSWMDDDAGSSVSHLCKRSLYEIQVRFEGRQLESSQRLSVINKLMDLPCLLAQCDKTDCLAQTANNNFLTVSDYLPLVRLLLDGAAGDSTPDFRRKVYLALSFIVQHHSATENLDSVVELLFHGIADADRSVRMSAGRALSGLVQLYGLGGTDGFLQAESIFTRLYQCFEQSRNPIRETLLVTVGSMGKTANGDVLGQVLCLLIAQLGKPNPIIKGSACMQILSIAKHYQKAPYSLILPYLDQVAPYIIKQLPIQRDLLGEACRVMSIAPADFIVTTLPRTLPDLFATCDQKVLDSITKELSTKASSLLVKHSHGILAHIFLLSSQVSTSKALHFVIKILNEATSSIIDIQSVVKSCVVPLLAELVVVMGDENPQVAQQGIIALKKVENTLAPGKKNVLTTPNLGTFLKTYMLGLISDINDMLQDVQGKKTVATKRKILRSLGALVEQIGPAITNVAPQIMATFQTMVSIPELSEVTLESWHKFLITLGTTELGPHVGPTSAAIVTSWTIFSFRAREIAIHALEYIVCTMGGNLGQYLGEIVDLSAIDDLRPLHLQLARLRDASSPEEELERVLNQSASDNLTVAMQALRELKTFMRKDHNEYMRKITSGAMFDPKIGRILASLFATACRDSGDGTEGLRLLSFECIGVLGAMDPDRCEIAHRNTSVVVMKNFVDDGEAVIFALHLIQDLLVGAFRSTSDIKYQSHLAYSIQELLKFCQFTPALVAAGGTTSVPMKVRNRWNALPKHVLETVTPLLEARFTLNQSSNPATHHPIYPTQSTYREWIQIWTTHLITKASGPTAAKLFGVFRSAVRNKDVVVAHHLLPHLVLNILISGNEDDALSIRSEMLTVLEDQVDLESNSTSDKKLLSAQAVFMLLDHLNKWVRLVRQEIASKKSDNKRPRPEQMTVQLEDQLLRLDSILANIDQSLMAKAAFQCKAFARSLMNFEQQIVTLQERGIGQKDLPEYYEKLHEIYAHLDEPDGMEGMSTLILSPSLEHQIRQHESTGRWTSAQSCWEVRLQESPDNVEFHLGLLRCLRNLGHYDTLRTHVAGVLTRHPDWESAMAGFQVESAWMVGAWDDVQRLAARMDINTSSIVMARVLLAMRAGEQTAISEALSQARSVLGAPITAAGVKGYRRSYEAVLDLHMTHELELIYQAASSIQSGSQDSIRHDRRRTLAELSQTLSARLDITLPTFRSREPLLSMRRTAFTLSKNTWAGLNLEVGKSWLSSAKIARKSKQWQTAYSATLQAQQSKAPYYFIESAKLLKASGEPLRALLELENSIKLLGLFDEQVLDLTADAESERMKAKIQVLRARWMNECDRFDISHIFGIFQEATTLQKNWESAHYYLGQFHDDCFKTLPASEQVKRGLKMNVYTIRCFSKAIMHGSKFVYQTIPRILTIWLDLGEDRTLASSDAFKKMTEIVARAMKEAPVFKWYTSFPQIVSRVAHDNVEVYKYLRLLIITVMEAYPKQALWLFTSVVKSTKPSRSTRGVEILNQLRNNPHNIRNQVSRLINESLVMTDQLLALCDQPLSEHKMTLSMSKDFPKLKALGCSSLIIPLQECLTASLPPTSAAESTHQPFPLDIPTFKEFVDEIDVMRSVARPRKITIKGSNGSIYMFLGKPKDDLRKDARMMDLNSIINKLLKGNSESRRRQLHIRTYGVVALNEECGFIQWVPNTIPIRPVLHKYYDARRIKSWTAEMGEVFKKIKEGRKDVNPAELFQTKILSIFKPVFHEWFIETFPEPTAWLASRLTFGRTAAVMSMVGFILGLGDRHCENILLDTNSGDVVHVDLNCLFEKGKSLETPERVPFRLTQNIIDGLGVGGVEGVFRISCEVTLQLLRDNKDSLMSVLDAFVHDPLVEWEDEKRKLDRDTRRSANAAAAKGKFDARALAKSALNPIEKKLTGIYSPGNSRERHEKVISTSNLVQMLIEEATDLTNLAKMYPGWAPWH
ncbi:hypothetical protein GALMADRAFT_219929 [Galerina marginata CBS 339.88]|uniref:non-specific serine/threonine protein kinase n=1 Tax=Galerina marginata (strain CBS 339.88) TaxID=685588 RepID=A0A067TYH3_GALM3|nr:hypothetical protein GALMADRAFT_219929 [Galerina marginata CBS 339.88]